VARYEPISAPSDPILIVGAPRSGTTWLAKICDSHPDVLYLHEPDSLLTEIGLPRVCRRDDPAWTGTASEYIARLQQNYTLKTFGKLPTFAKSWRSRSANALWRASVLGLQAIAWLGGNGEAFERLRLPAPRRATYRRTVIKSVSARGRIGLIVGAISGGRIILLLRHPCGQIASVLRGIASGKITMTRHGLGSPEDLRADILATGEAAGHGLDPGQLEVMPLSELLAWHWAMLNQKVLDDLAGDPRLQVISYEALRHRPLDVAREIFERVELPWCESTARFIRRSTNYRGPHRYYGVMRNTGADCERWRYGLGSTEQSRILEIVRRFRAGRLATDYAPWTDAVATSGPKH
jgi:hypothetical protein